MDNVSQLLQQHILSEYLPGEEPENLQNDTPLVTSGVLDSISTLKLISFIEQEFSIQIKAHETGVENFDTIERIAALIERKQSGEGG